MPAIAVPSCLVPGTVAQNVHFITTQAQGKIQEIGLCFFETRPCLAYGDVDLPPALAELDFLWHVHLPVDLPWHVGPEAAANCALRLMGKVAALKPRAAVLHVPPGQAKALLMAFAALWQARCAIPLLLENTESSALLDLATLIIDAEFGICLDVAHMLAYKQQAILTSPELLARVAMLHWSAPGNADRHLSLDQFSSQEKELACQVVRALPANCTHMIEVFNWSGVQNSLPILTSLLQQESRICARPNLGRSRINNI